jgi:putative ABC transport system ATP-binding protein
MENDLGQHLTNNCNKLSREFSESEQISERNKSFEHDNIILEVRNLEKIYNEGETNEIRALQGINFSIMKGELVSIMGPSGSGKSTLLNLIGALDTPSKGEVLIRNQFVAYMSEKKLTQFRRKEIGFVFQHYNLIPVLSALENVELSMTLSSIKKEERRNRSKYLLDLVGLKNRMNNRPDEMSGGEIQRVSIARALSNKPSIVLADEPTGNLDSKKGMEIMSLFKELNQKENQTFIIVTHDPTVAKQTDKTIHIKDGMLDTIEIHRN